MNEGNGNHGRAPRIMFLVGAGISIPVGIPAMQGIYAGFLRKEKSSITDLEQKTCKFLTENLKVRPDLEEFLLAANAITSFRNSPLAAFVEASVSNRSYGTKIEEYRKRAKKRASQVEAVRNRILEYLARTCFEFDRPKAVEIFGDFVESIASAGYPFSLRTMTSRSNTLPSREKLGSRITLSSTGEGRGRDGCGTTPLASRPAGP